MIACLGFSAVRLLKRETKQSKKESWMFRDILKPFKGVPFTEARKGRWRPALQIPWSGDMEEFIAGWFLCILHFKVTLQVYLGIPLQQRKEHLANSRLYDPFFEERTPLWERLREQARGPRPRTITHCPDQIVAFFPPSPGESAVKHLPARRRVQTRSKRNQLTS